MKKIFILFTHIFLLNCLFAFDWPLEEVSPDLYKSDFGQNMSGNISTSLIFNSPDPVKISEDGKILAVIQDYSDDTNFFPSTLGTAVIVAHEDNLLSVYGNIDKEKIYISSENNYSVEKGQHLGECANSGWQSGNSTLEFQIIDIKNSSAINPKVMLPHLDSALPLTISDITLRNKKNEFFSLNERRTFPTGIYKIYRKRNTVAVPYQSSVLVNGIEYDQINYNILVEENGKICVIGKKRKYVAEEVYPNDKLQLIGEVMLSPGKTSLNLIVTDFLNKSRQINYNLTIY
ncbi:MAG: M23 family metallopeptidase [Treponema sp.]|nr:M23 family metallopeptidase [Treponema sp.]